jgi:hypothetical protein
MGSWGILVFAIIVGAVIALIVFGLPLAIIGLFIASILDRRNKRPPRVTKNLSLSVLDSLFRLKESPAITRWMAASNRNNRDTARKTEC